MGAAHAQSSDCEKHEEEEERELKAQEIYKLICHEPWPWMWACGSGMYHTWQICSVDAYCGARILKHGAQGYHLHTHNDIS